MTLDEHDKAGLSPEEIAAIEADLGDEDSPADERAGQDEHSAQAEQQTAAAPAAADADQEGAAAADATAAQPPAAQADDDIGAKPTVTVVTPDVSEYDSKIAALRTEKKEAFQKLLDGDMKPEEYSAIEARVDDQTDALKQQRADHHAEVRRAQASAQAEWQWECKRFMRDALKAEGIDYATDKKLGKELDGQLKMLSQDPDNAERNAEWFLSEAHRRVKAINGIAAVAKTPAPAPAPARPTPDLSKVAPTLARVPVAANPALNGDEFGHMRNLEGNDYERAIARMTPEQLDRFLA